MEVREIISDPVKIAGPETMLDEVAKMMLEQDCGSIPVAKNDKLVGMITDRDIVLRCVAKGMDPMTVTAEHCMSNGILYCYDTDDIEDVAENMADNKIHRLPVVDKDKRLVGIVSLGDIALACEEKQIPGEALSDIHKAA